MQPSSGSVRSLPNVLIGFLLLVGSARIAMTYRVFNQVTDEPAHIATGMEWLDLGTYVYEPLHPPLARVASALGPFLDGLRLPAPQRALLTEVRDSHRLRNRYGSHQVYDNFYDSVINAAMWRTGNELLYAGDAYWRHLTLARLGILPFFLLAGGLVWIWARRLFGNWVALVAVLLLTTLPPVLAHAALATTDMAAAATLCAASLAWTLWLERPSVGRSLLLGAASALALLSKLSLFLFLPACALAILVWRVSLRSPNPAFRASGVRRTISSLLVAASVTFVVIWAGYRFSLAPLAPASQRPHTPVDRIVGSSGPLHDFAYSVVEAPILPAAELLDGLDQLWYFNPHGHESYLLGKVSDHGWRYLFLVSLAVKTPLGFLLLSAIGLAATATSSRRTGMWQVFSPGAAVCAFLVACLASRLNIGVRHVLPVYPFLSILAGYGAVRLWHLGQGMPTGRVVAIVLVGWHLASSFLAHPDYLAYFNEFAGPKPERILVDSDLDWGQDLARLADELRRRDIKVVSIAYFGTADLARHGLPAYNVLPRGEVQHGWIAISKSSLMKDEGYRWLRQYEPVSEIGRSILLYYIGG